MRTIETLAILMAVILTLLIGSGSAFAGHIPLSLDVTTLWTGLPGDGYLEFINPTEHPGLIGVSVPTTPPGAIVTEEHTGYTTVSGTDIIEVGDGDLTAGDRADFDWVQENRSDEFAGISNHSGMVGAMGWTPGSPETSPHIDPGTGAAHGHSVAEGFPFGLPELNNDIFTLPFFTMVDVFSIISVGEDSDATARDAALDYLLDFGNSVTGLSSPGVPVLVWMPGWTAVTGIDDFVARWMPAIPGLYDLVAIEPAFGFGHDEVTEIDAIKAFNANTPVIPEPSTIILFGIGMLGIIGIGYRKRKKVTEGNPREAA